MQSMRRVLREIAIRSPWPRFASTLAFCAVFPGVPHVGDWASLWRLVVLGFAVVCMASLAEFLHLLCRWMVRRNHHVHARKVRTVRRRRIPVQAPNAPTSLQHPSMSTDTSSEHVERLVPRAGARSDT